MQQKVVMNDYPIDAWNVQLEQTNDYTLQFDFLVKHEEYHEVTTLLYENDFIVNLPASNITFSATITNYATSITNLYEAGAEGKFHLQLTEKP